MSGSCDNHFRIRISNLQQWRIFSFKGFLPGDIVADLNIDFLTAFLGYKINFFLIQLSNINIVTTAQKFDADHIFINSAVIHISAAQDCITNPRITQIEFLGAFQILLATNIISLNIIENKSVAQIFDIFAHRYVTCRYIIRIQKLTDLVRRSQIADIVHQELAQSLQNGCIR